LKNDISRSFYRRVAVNILYSAVIACLTEIFLITNVDMLVNYLQTTEHAGALWLSVLQPGTLATTLYVILGILIFSVSFLLLQRKSFQYIGKVAAAVRNISEGDLNTPVEVEGDDEFASMAASLNRMEADIRELMDKEREAERTKNELITNVAHDLRTPLTSIIGYLELLSVGGPLGEEQKQKYIDIAYTKARRLEKLIEDLFGFTKMNYGKATMCVGNVDIVKLLEQLLEEAYPSFAEQNLTYELKSNTASQMITADGNLLARLFDNLINNAIKYGADGKRVEVKVQTEGEIVTVFVTNYGYVIPAGELPLIFNKFYRVEQSRSSSTGGTGLGLAIVKNIVDMHGGSISVASDMNGTVFTVKLRVNFDISKENFGTIG
jgi:two-component system sensor histidine kinase VanS